MAYVSLRGVWVLCMLYFTTLLLNAMIRSSPAYSEKKSVLQGEPFFDSNSPLGEEPNCKYEKLRNWPRMLGLEDYAYDMSFLMGK
jgi:hypothetical protein